MIEGYAALSESRVRGELRRAQCRLIADGVAKHRPLLEKLLQHDKEVFDDVIAIRKKRDRAKNSDEKKRIQNRHRTKLKKATELVLQIASECLAVARLGVQIFGVGFKGARGEAATAVHSALAGAQSGLVVGLLNLTSFRGGKWAKKLHARCAQLWEDIIATQNSVWTIASRLRGEADDAVLGPVGQSDLLGLLGPAQQAISVSRQPPIMPRRKRAA